MTLLLLRRLAAGALAMTLTTAAPARDHRRRPLAVARGGAGREGPGLGARAQCADAAAAAGLARLRGHARAHPAGAGLARPHPGHRAARRLRLQLLAGRRQPARPVAAHHAGRIPPGRAGLGTAARRRCAGPQRRRELGLGRRGLPGPGLPPLPGQAVARRRRRAGGARVRHRDAAVRGRRLQPARGQVRRGLAGPRHGLRRHRFRPRLAHRFGLPAHHQALAARPAAGRRGDGVRGAARRRRRQRARRPHARLRAHAAAARARLLQQRGVPARRRPVAASWTSRPTHNWASGTARC